MGAPFDPPQRTQGTQLGNCIQLLYPVFTTLKIPAKRNNEVSTGRRNV